MAKWLVIVAAVAIIIPIGIVVPEVRQPATGGEGG